jgi:hypothetical protein
MEFNTMLPKGSVVPERFTMWRQAKQNYYEVSVRLPHGDVKSFVYVEKYGILYTTDGDGNARVPSVFRVPVVFGKEVTNE